MLQALRNLRAHWVPLLLVAIFVAGGLGRSLHSLEHVLEVESACAVDHPEDLVEGEAVTSSGESAHADAADCSLCLLSAHDCLTIAGQAPIPFAAGGSDCFPTPQAAPRAGPQGLAPARAPPTAARA